MILTNSEPHHGAPARIEGTPEQVLGVLALESTKVRRGSIGWRGEAEVSVGSERATFPLERGWSLMWLQHHIGLRVQVLHG